MNRDEFWQIIETARLATDNDPDAQSEAIEAHLRTLPDGELIAFHTHFDTLYAPTYRMNLWGAAYIINGGLLRRLLRLLPCLADRARASHLRSRSRQPRLPR